jgi:hypothetical protein
MPNQSRLRLRGAPIIHDTIDNETIAINQLTGAYYSLEGPSALVWQRLAEGSDEVSLTRAIQAAYEGDPSAIEADVRSFLELLLAEELIVPAEETEAPEASGKPVDEPVSEGGRPSFTGLKLQRYTDLEVLLLADPIHEVDETGWPKPVSQPEQ